MAGTWIFLPPEGGGGGGGGSAFYGDPVANASLLPASGSVGEIRYAILENQFYSWTGAAWTLAPNLLAIAASTSTDGYLTSVDWNTFDGKEPPITAGTTSQYWRGDKSWQDLTTDAIITSDGSAASASQKLGESIQSAEPSALSSVGAGATGVWGEAASVLVPAGRWAIGGVAYVQQGTANLSNIVQAGLSLEAAPASVPRSATASTAALITGDFEQSLVIVPRTYNFAAPTTIYINTKFIYDSGTPLHAGFITGWRIA